MSEPLQASAGPDTRASAHPALGLCVQSVVSEPRVRESGAAAEERAGPAEPSGQQEAGAGGAARHGLRRTQVSVFVSCKTGRGVILTNET